MCTECGCSETDDITIDGEPLERSDHHHSVEPSDHHHGGGDPADGVSGASVREISLKRDILHKNNHIAQRNREYLATKGVFCMNWISAPGSGKTAMLERLISDYGSTMPFSVIEGDQQTDNDSQRIRRAGAEALQINTGAACHLDAEMIQRALERIDLERTRLLIIENVGNMVCPTAYDLGETLKVALISCPEGEDKPVKYPDLILSSQVLLINKIDLIPHLDFDLENCISSARKINPAITVFPVSAKTGEGVDEFYSWFAERLNT
ncbi:MAG: hydrogenase nickel incorporation protein HypB [Proteobacteria bacterium]|nr:hydrogenase nickel incorporation protein HypB [Pseudomonadota bacterium]